MRFRYSQKYDNIPTFLFSIFAKIMLTRMNSQIYSKLNNIRNLQILYSNRNSIRHFIYKYDFHRFSPFFSRLYFSISFTPFAFENTADVFLQHHLLRNLAFKSSKYLELYFCFPFCLAVSSLRPHQCPIFQRL